MAVPTYILFVLGCLGVTDIMLYHSVSHGIRTHHDSRLELVIHSLRGPTYAVLFVAVPNLTMHGVWFWALMGVFGLDVCISLGDFMIERASRAFFGGLPTGEYVLHILLAMLFGALVASVGYSVGDWAWMPTRLAYDPTAGGSAVPAPAALRGVMAVMAALVLGSGVMDLAAVVRLTREGPDAP